MDPASQLGNTVINLSKTHLGPFEHKLLEKGLNYIPTPRQVSTIPILEAVTKFERRLKLAYHFRRSKFYHREKFVSKSSWSPDDKDMPADIGEIIKKISDDISNIQVPNPQNNLTDPEITALKNLRRNSDIIIKPADKGSATVIMDRQNYINEGYRQLDDARYYEKIDAPIFHDTGKKINEILFDLQNRHIISPKQYDYLKAPENARPRHFYMLPKIHKPLEKWPVADMPPGRPIISDCSSESYHVSEYIDHFLQPLASKHASYIKDTSDFLNKLKQARVNAESLLVTIDVESMYTNIDHESGLAAVKKAFEDNPDPSRPDDEILKLLELSLKNNDFEFNGETFLQTSGTAMGKKFAPSYANIFMAHWETEAFKKCYQIPEVYFRFLDDGFIIWNHGREQFDTFFEILNSHHPNIRLTARIEKLSIDFLDVTVFKGRLLHERNRLDTKVYFKPTDTHQLLHKASFHPKHTFRGILKSQIIRFKRISSQNSDFNEACSIVFKSLRTRGYSARSLRYIKNDTIREIESGKFFTPPGMDQVPSEDHFAKKCGNRFCHTCYLVRECSSVSSNTTKFVFKIGHDLNCNSSNIIYLIHCKECDKQYIGQTKRSLRHRTNNHRNDVLNKRQTSVGTHFNSNACMFDDFEIIPIYQCPKYSDEELTTKTRLEIEQYFIRSFKTYLPYGMNISQTKFHDSPVIHFNVPYSTQSNAASKIVRTHFQELQNRMPDTFNQYVVTAFSRNKNLKDMLVSSKLNPA